MSSPETTERSAVDRVADRLFERYLELNPISATILGDDRFDDRLPDPGPQGRADRRRYAEDLIAAADGIPDDGLGVEDRITRDVMRVIGEIAITEDDQRIDVLHVVDQMGGPQTLLPQLCQFQAADTLTNLYALWKRPVHIETVLGEERAVLSFDGIEHERTELGDEMSIRP